MQGILQLSGIDRIGVFASRKTAARFSRMKKAAITAAFCGVSEG